MKTVDPINGVPRLTNTMARGSKFKWGRTTQLWPPMYVNDFGNVTLICTDAGPSFYADLSVAHVYTEVCSVYRVNPADLAWHYEQCHHLKQSVPFVAPELEDDVFVAIKMRTMDKRNRNDGATGYVSHKAIASVWETSKKSCIIRMHSGYEFEAMSSYHHIETQRWRGVSFNWQLRGSNWVTRPDFLTQHSPYSHKPNR